MPNATDIVHVFFWMNVLQIYCIPIQNNISRTIKKPQFADFYSRTVAKAFIFLILITSKGPFEHFFPGNLLTVHQKTCSVNLTTQPGSKQEATNQ